MKKYTPPKTKTKNAQPQNYESNLTHKKHKCGKKSKGEDRQKSLVVYNSPHSPVAEAYRSLKSHFQFSRLEADSKIILMTSSSLQEGKSFNAVNLAMSLAQTGDRVLLVDADLRKPVLHQIFGIDLEPGLTDYLWGNCELKDTIKTVIDILAGKFEMGDLLKTPGLDYLHIITAGSNPLNPWGVLRSPRFKQMLDEVRTTYDTIIIDSPPVLSAADTCDIAAEVDGIIMVYEVGRISRSILKRAKEQLESSRARVLGVILNKIRPEVAPLAYQYYTSYHPYAVTKTEEGLVVETSVVDRLKKHLPDRLSLGSLGGHAGRRLLSIALGFSATLILLLTLLWQNFPGLRFAYYALLKMMFSG